MPPENRVRRDDRRDLREDPAAEALTDDRETSTLVVIQPQPPAVQLRFQDAILFPEEFDDVALLPFEPAEQRRDNQCSGITHGVYDTAASTQFSRTLRLTKETLRAGPWRILPLTSSKVR